MLNETSAMANLIDRVSEVTGQDRSEDALFLVSQFLSKSSDEMSQKIVEALRQVIPPWETQGLRLRLEILATYWAFALVVLGMPSTDPTATRVGFVRRGQRLRNRIEAELNNQQLYGHLHLLLVLDDRFWALSHIPTMVKEFSDTRRGRTRQDPVLIEATLVGGTFKAALRSRLIRLYLAQMPRTSRRHFADRSRAAIELGLSCPWFPVLNDEDRSVGKDILVREGLARSGPLEMAKLLAKLVTRKVIKPEDPVGFVLGLTENKHFMRSANRAKDDCQSLN